MEIFLFDASVALSTSHEVLPSSIDLSDIQQKPAEGVKEVLL